MFSSEGRKDSLAFIEETKEFVCNLATFDLRDADERRPRRRFRAASTRWSEAGLDAGAIPAGAAAAGRRLALRARMQAACRSCSSTDIDGQPLDRHVVFGQVVGVHIDDALHQERPARYRRDGADRALRLHDYAVVDKVFSIPRMQPPLR